MLVLNDLLLFAQVVEAGSFANAGRRLSKPPNSISRRIQELEAALGLQLLRRSTRKLVLTPAGTRLYEETASRLADVLQAARGLTDEQEVPRGTLRIAAPTDFLDGFPGEWIREFFGSYPGVRLEALLDDQRVDLLEHNIDLAFRGGASTEPQLVSELIGNTKRILVASPEYLAARGEPSTIAELTDHDCVALLGKHAERSWRLAGPNGEEVQIPGRFSASTIRSLLLAAISGLGIAMLPAAITRPAIADGRLREVLPGIASHPFGVYFVYRAGTRLPKVAIAFQAFVTAKLLATGILTSTENAAHDR